MVEYVSLIGGTADLSTSLQQFLSKLMDFLQTPEGWALMAIIAVLFFVFKR